MEPVTCQSCERAIPADAGVCPYCGEVRSRDELDAATDVAGSIPLTSSDEGSGEGGDGDWLISHDHFYGEFHEEPPSSMGGERHADDEILAIGLEGHEEPGEDFTSPAAELMGDVVAAQAEPFHIPEPEPIAGVAFTDSHMRRIAFLRAKLEKGPVQPQVVLSLAQVHEEAQDEAGAVHYYQACLALDPGSSYATERIHALDPEGTLRRRAAKALGTEPGAVDVEGGPGTGRGTTTIAPPATDEPLRLATDPPLATTPRGPATSGPVPSGPVSSGPGSRTTTARPAGARPARVPRRRQPQTKKTSVVPLLVLAGMFVAAAIGLGVKVLFPSQYSVLGTGRKASMNPTFSPSGQYLAFFEPPQQADMETVVRGFHSGGSSTLHVQRTGRRSTVRSFPNADASPRSGRAIVWGGDDRLAYTTARGEIAVADLTSPDPPALIEGRGPALSPDGRYLAYERSTRDDPGDGDAYYGDTYAAEGDVDVQGDDRQLFVYDLDQRQERQLTTEGGRSPVWSPAGDRIVYERHLYSVEHRESTDLVAGTRESDARPRWTGVALEVIDADGSGTPTRVAPDGINRHARWTAGGRGLSWVHWDVDPGASRGGDHGYAGGGGARLADAELWAADADGTGAAEVLSFANDAVSLHTTTWSPEGDFLIYLGLTVPRDRLVLRAAGGVSMADLADKVELHLWDAVARYPLPLEDRDRQRSRTHPALSPDGRYLAYTEVRGGVPQVHVTRFASVDPR